MYWQGIWSAATDYKVGDGVHSEGSSYVCVAAHRSIVSDSPPSVKWDLLAAKGDYGATSDSRSCASNGYEIVLRESEYNQGTGCGKTARPGCAGGAGNRRSYRESFTNRKEEIMNKKVTVPFTISTVALAGVLFVSTYVPAIASSDCSNLKGCEKKFCEIERQLNIAQKNGNERKVDGLERSLKNAKAHCTDKALKEDLIGEIEEAQKDITEYESDLKEAEQYGKMDKVRKYRVKIEEEKNKIKHLKDELSNLN